MRDSTTGAPAATGAQLTAQEHHGSTTYADTAIQSFDSLHLSVGGLAGTYDLKITKLGYATWTRNGVVVISNDGGCHPTPVLLDAELPRAPQRGLPFEPEAAGSRLAVKRSPDRSERPAARAPGATDEASEPVDATLPCYVLESDEARRKLASTNSLERHHHEVRRRTRVIQIFPHEASLLRLLTALAIEQNDNWRHHRW